MDTTTIWWFSCDCCFGVRTESHRDDSDKFFIQVLSIILSFSIVKKKMFAISASKFDAVIVPYN